MSTNIGELSDIEMSSGVNDDHVGFVHIRAIGTIAGEPVVLIGQLDPATIRQHALAYLESAEAAEHDAALVRLLAELEMPDELIGHLIGNLRNQRSGS